MPLFGAIEDKKRLVDECYKFMNYNDFANSRIEWDPFCTGTCTACVDGYGRCSVESNLLDVTGPPPAWCKDTGS
jgi:hypothetical protein